MKSEKAGDLFGIYNPLGYLCTRKKKKNESESHLIYPNVNIE